MGRIYYASASQYARDHEIELQPFLTFLMAMDDEYVSWASEKAKAEADAAKDNAPN